MRPTRPARISLPVSWGRYRLEVSDGESGGPLTSVTFDAGFYAEASADTPDLLEIALDKAEYSAGDTINVAVTARSAGRVTLDVVGDRLITSTSQDVQPGVNKLKFTVGKDWGNGAYVVAPCAARSTPRRTACRAAPSACNGSRSTAKRKRWRSI